MCCRPPAYRWLTLWRDGAARSNGKRLPVAHNTLDFLEAERTVGGMALVVLQHGVRANFGEPAQTRPVLGRFDKRAADASVARFGGDVPGFDVGHGRRGAPFRVSAQREFEEACEASSYF